MRTQIVREKTKHLFEIISAPFTFIHPNVISLIGLSMIVGVFYFFMKENYLVAAIFIVLNGFFDVMDGIVARKTKKESLFGKLLDRTSDKISDAGIISAFIVFNLVNLGLGLYALVSMLIATNISANLEGVLKVKISDAVSLRFLRSLIVIVLLPFKQFFIIFILLSIISTYAIISRIFYAVKVSN